MIDLEQKFTYQEPNAQQVKLYAQLRESAKSLAYQIQLNVPQSAEKDIAINKLRESVMWANSAIALHWSDK